MPGWATSVFGETPLLLRLPLIGLVGGMAAGLIGCGPAAEVRLFQPQYVGVEQDIRLQTDHVCWAPGHGMARFLAEFPLPGAVSGRPTYLLYLRVPMIASAETRPAGNPQAVRGFLIQTQGRNAGLEILKSANVSVKGRSMASDAPRELEVELTFEGNTTLKGRLNAKRNDRHLKHFETRRRPADVQALLESPKSGEIPDRRVP